MTQTPAGWYADPDDAAQYRYWDGAQWTEHRAPRTVATSGPAATGGTTSEQLTAAGRDIADGIAGAFTSLGGWMQQNVRAGAGAGQPTFESVDASCRPEPVREPLSQYVELELTEQDVAAVGRQCAASGAEVTPAGVQLPHEVCRLVPNPWDPADPTGVAVFVGTTRVGRLPADLAAAYCPPLARLTQQRLLATGTATLYAEGPGAATSARVTLSLPEASAFA